MKKITSFIALLFFMFAAMEGNAVAAAKREKPVPVAWSDDKKTNEPNINPLTGEKEQVEQGQVEKGEKKKKKKKKKGEKGKKKHKKAKKKKTPQEENKSENSSNEKVTPLTPGTN